MLLYSVNSQKFESILNGILNFDHTQNKWCSGL